MPKELTGTDISCFFCNLEEPDSLVRRNEIKNYFRNMHLVDDQELILVLSGLWRIAMTESEEGELPSLGLFECMASLIDKGIKDRDWLHRNQNIYIPYYAAHIVGSYTMNNVDLAVKAVEAGTIPPLLDLLRGNMSWVEQRVAVRALGHLASYERTFEAVSTYEEEVVKVAMHLASTCVEVVYNMFVGVKDKNKRLKYHCDLLTRGAGLGDMETENRKAEEWASQLQCWCLNLLNCFAIKGMSLDLICKPSFLSRSSDDWQYMGIDCLLLLLKDPDTEYKVMEASISCLIDLIEVKNLGGRANVGEIIKRTLCDLKLRNSKAIMSPDEKKDEQRVLVALIKQQGNHCFSIGRIQEAINKYTEAIELCPLRLKKERIVLYSNRAQGYLLQREPDAAISDTTRALCLSNPPNSHLKSLT